MKLIETYKILAKSPTLCVHMVAYVYRVAQCGDTFYVHVESKNLNGMECYEKILHKGPGSAIANSIYKQMIKDLEVPPKAVA